MEKMRERAEGTEGDAWEGQGGGQREDMTVKEWRGKQAGNEQEEESKRKEGNEKKTRTRSGSMESVDEEGEEKMNLEIKG